ncbi:MAG: alpha/beta hydrolase [Lachnospiraceae bacterium]|nr:alpha/beta hydrolase [Lachnospiraceae bacterium]
MMKMLKTAWKYKKKIIDTMETYEKKKKSMIWIMPTAFITLFAILFLLWILDSNGKIREYKDAKGNVIPGSISEKTIIEINGAKNGLFINGKDINNPVLLLISSGPGTDDYFLTERYPDMHIDDLFTVVYWDYRGMGIAYDSNINPDVITMDLLLEDLKEITDYCKKRFNKDKIYLMGFSGGTQIGIKAAKEHPEDYYAYIGMAQVVTDSSERDMLMYDFMKEEFIKKNDAKNLKKLEENVDFSNGEIHCKDWRSFVMLVHEAGGGTIRGESEFKGIDIPIMLSHCYTVTEKINYIRGLKMYDKTMLEKEMTNIDFRKDLNEFEIPIFFISGEYDYNCPWPLAEDYANVLTAPDKGFYKIKDAAHSPLWENTEDSFDVFKEIKEKTYER